MRNPARTVTFGGTMPQARKMSVDDFVKSKVQPEYQGVTRRLRTLMRKLAPDVVEDFSYGMPVWKGRKILAWLMPTKNDVTLGFTKGARFEDKYGRLGGTAKHGRHIRLKSIKDLDEKVLAYYVKQALKLDRE